MTRDITRSLDRIPFIDPTSGEALTPTKEWLSTLNGRKVARIHNGIPRFVELNDNYAETFGWQWNNWTDTLSDSRSKQSEKRKLLLERTHFGEYQLEGKAILECGMGGGDDTEVLLSLPFW